MATCMLWRLFCRGSCHAMLWGLSSVPLRSVSSSPPSTLGSFSLRLSTRLKGTMQRGWRGLFYASIEHRILMVPRV